jgi:hypothetical protein
MQSEPFLKRYSVTFDFEIELSPKTVGEESDAAENLDEDEQEQLLQCEQQVVGILLDDWRDELDIWVRAYILEMISSGDIDMFAAAKRITLCLHFSEGK